MDLKSEGHSRFDVIVAGAGPAGCVLASRLSENPHKKILLLEAGPDATAPGAEHPDILDPFCLSASANRTFRWPGLVAKMGLDRGAPTAIEEPVEYLQGYGVGGASNINGMGADRGIPADYDEWASLGAEGWGWSDVLPYFRKLEHDLDFFKTEHWHGARGPMPVRRLSRSRWAPFSAAVAKAAERRELPFIEDYNADFRAGFSGVPTNCLPNKRISASMAYLNASVRSRSNLSILSDVRVDRVSLDGNRADGVFVHHNGATSLIPAREIILSCGALQTPALLLRSGLGPLEELKRHGIRVVRDMPGIGANLQNHPHVTLAVYLTRRAMQPADNVWFLQNWLRYSSNHPRCHPCDMHVLAFNKCAWHAMGSRVGAVTVSVLKAYSKGRIALRSAAPGDVPDVQFNLLADPRDEDRLVSGVRFIFELLDDPSVSAMRREVFTPNGRIVKSLSPCTIWNRLVAHGMAMVLDRPAFRCRLLRRARVDTGALLQDEVELRRFVRRSAGLQYHVCGTCRMGRESDSGAVVDSNGRVHGIEGLRIADASIFPTVPRGYTHFIVIMAAEKLADQIKVAWG